MRGETPINWCKMLSYAGMLAGRSRSPQVVSGIIAHCFDIEDVDIRQWVQRKVDIRLNQQMQLGMANMNLGDNTVIGERVTECNGKFTLVLKGLSQERFRDFLPTGKEYQPLCKVVEFVLRANGVRPRTAARRRRGVCHGIGQQGRHAFGMVDVLG